MCACNHAEIDFEMNRLRKCCDDYSAQVKDLLRSIQVFRNCPALGPLAVLRGTPEYSQLCDAWDRHATIIYGQTSEGRPNAPTIHIPADW